MRLRKCKKCGREYQTDRPGTYFCPECSAEYFKSAPMAQRTCRQCGATFRGGPRAWYCPSCRADRQKQAAEKRRKHGTLRPLGSTDICQRCGGEYVVEGGRQMYCKACAEEAVREKTRTRKREYLAENRETINAHKREMRTDRKICTICGAVFDSGTPSVTCSPACAAKLKKLWQDNADIRRGRRKSPAGQKYVSGLPKSGVVGVTARNGRWQAIYKKKYLGIFPTVSEAKAAIEEEKARGETGEQEPKVRHST